MGQGIYAFIDGAEKSLIISILVSLFALVILYSFFSGSNKKKKVHNTLYDMFETWAIKAMFVLSLLLSAATLLKSIAGMLIIKMKTVGYILKEGAEGNLMRGDSSGLIDVLSGNKMSSILGDYYFAVMVDSVVNVVISSIIIFVSWKTLKAVDVYKNKKKVWDEEDPNKRKKGLSIYKVMLMKSPMYFSGFTSLYFLSGYLYTIVLYATDKYSIESQAVKAFLNAL